MDNKPCNIYNKPHKGILMWVLHLLKKKLRKWQHKQVSHAISFILQLEPVTDISNTLSQQKTAYPVITPPTS